MVQLENVARTISVAYGVSLSKDYVKDYGASVDPIIGYSCSIRIRWGAPQVPFTASSISDL